MKGALHFRARIGIKGINPFILVSARRAAQLQDGWRRPLPVLAGGKGRFMARSWNEGA